MAKLDQFISRLKKVRKNGDGYVACCPAHEDDSPSLTVTEKDGLVLAHCFAGCSIDEIVSSVGMNLSDLMPENDGYQPKKHQRIYFNPYDVLAAVRDDMTVALVLAKDMQNGRALHPSESLLLAKLIGRMSAAIALAGGKE